MNSNYWALGHWLRWRQKVGNLGRAGGAAKGKVRYLRAASMGVSGMSAFFIGRYPFHNILGGIMIHSSSTNTKI